MHVHGHLRTMAQGKEEACDLSVTTDSELHYIIKWWLFSLLDTKAGLLTFMHESIKRTELVTSFHRADLRPEIEVHGKQ